MLIQYRVLDQLTGCSANSRMRAAAVFEKTLDRFQGCSPARIVASLMARTLASSTFSILRS